MRVGLVLGAGGVQGGAWLTGGLDALAEETGWDPGERRPRRRHLGRLDDRRAAAPPGSRRGSWSPTRRGETLRRRRRRRTAARPRRPTAPAGAVFRARADAGRRSGPGSWRLALRTPAHPRRHTPARVLSGWLPRGIVSTEPLQDTIRRVVPSGWGPHPNSGSSPATTRPAAASRSAATDAPPAELADAVAASCAIPGFYHPVDDRRPPLRRRRHPLDLEPRRAARRASSTS